MNSESRPADTLPRGLADWLAELSGWNSIDSVAECGWAGGACRVFRVQSDTVTAYLKQHPSPRTYAQEGRALRSWATCFDRAPQLLSSNRQLRSLLISSVAGSPHGEVSPDCADRAELHRDAGRQLSRLHALPFRDTDTLSYADAMVRRVDSWSDRGADIVTAPDRERVQAAVAENRDFFRDARRVPCHLDYDERNWLVAPGSSTGVIDFEHSRPDHWIADLVRLETGDWATGGESLKRAFFEGYGRSLTSDDQRRLDVLSAVWSLATVVWSVERGDSRFEALGRRGLERLENR